MLEFNTSTEAAQYLNKLKFGLSDMEFAAKYRFLKEDGAPIIYHPIFENKNFFSHLHMERLENANWGIFIEEIYDGFDDETRKYISKITNMGRVAGILTN
jgi:hypothetical protein